jgi:hypothetical protein
MGTERPISEDVKHPNSGEVWGLRPAWVIFLICAVCITAHLTYLNPTGRREKSFNSDAILLPTPTASVPQRIQRWA